MHLKFDDSFSSPAFLQGKQQQQQQQESNSQDPSFSNHLPPPHQHPGNRHEGYRPDSAAPQAKPPGASATEGKQPSLDAYLPDIFAFITDHGLVAQAQEKVSASLPGWSVTTGHPKP